MTSFQATILVGIALLVSNIITLFAATKMPRRCMLILSSLGISLALIAMGVYFYLKTLEKTECLMNDLVANHSSSNSNNLLLSSASAESLKSEAAEANLTDSTNNCPATYTEDIGWLPMFILMIYILFFNLGYGAMIWITVVEILPLHIRSVATSLSVGFTCVCSFLTSHTYNDLKAQIKGEGIFWLYGSISFIGLIFICCCVPETKGKTDAQIQEYFERPKGQRSKVKASRKKASNPSRSTTMQQQQQQPLATTSTAKCT